MAKRALGPASAAIAAAIGASVNPDLPWLVGCSGGRDSLALAVVAAQVAARRQQVCTALVVDHGLQAGSAEVAIGVAAQLRQHGLEVRVQRVDVGREGGLEAAARVARYRALDEAAAEVAGAGGQTEIMLGHTMDDQAETVILGLQRGSGLRALAGMPQRRGRVVRPLLGLRRAVTTEACRELALSWWDDPHNSDGRFTRIRVRDQLLPLWENSLGPGVTEALARTAELAQDDADYLDQLAARAVDAEVAELDCATLAPLAPALRRRALLAWLRFHGSEVSRVHVLAVDSLVTSWRGQGPIDVPGLRVIRRDNHLAVEPA